jgi:hypothetical protein
MKMNSEKYQSQMREAAKEEQRMLDRLRAAGWVWSDDTQEWTHPNHPDVTISR